MQSEFPITKGITFAYLPPCSSFGLLPADFRTSASSAGHQGAGARSGVCAVHRRRASLSGRRGIDLRRLFDWRGLGRLRTESPTDRPVSWPGFTGPPSAAARPQRPDRASAGPPGLQRELARPEEDPARSLPSTGRTRLQCGVIASWPRFQWAPVSSSRAPLCHNTASARLPCDKTRLQRGCSSRCSISERRGSRSSVLRGISANSRSTEDSRSDSLPRIRKVGMRRPSFSTRKSLTMLK